MTTKSRPFATLVGTALVSCSITAVQAQEAVEKPPNTQLPNQIPSTGEEDAPQAAAAAARSALSTDSRSTDSARLESDLIRMTSESSTGLVAVKQSDGSMRVDLEGRFMSVAVATPKSDGGVEITCHTGQEALEKVKHARELSTQLNKKKEGK
jgi:hypothetical protein